MSDLKQVSVSLTALGKSMDSIRDERDAALARVAEVENEQVQFVRVTMDKIAQLEADLAAARTDAELAAKHRKASDELIQDCLQHMHTKSDEIVDVSAEDEWEDILDVILVVTPNDKWMNGVRALERRATALLGEVKHV